MADSARVHSIDAIKVFRGDLAQYGEDARHALDAVEMEIRRALDWLKNDQFLYWRGEIKRRNEEVSRARVELHRRKMMQMSQATAYDTDQKEALRIAENRLRTAERKLEAVKRWIPMLEHAVAEYQGQGRALADMLDGDLKKALGLLDRMAGALDDYVRMAPPSAPSAAPAESGDGGTPA